MEGPISVQRWARVESLLDAVLTLPPAQRARFLAQQTGDDEGLVRDVQRLLDDAQTRGDLLDRPATALLRETVAPGMPAGTPVGVWRVLEPVGRGGMGEVYRAERADGQFQQQVALKLIRREAVDQIERFHDERRTLARLDHAGIARLFDGGVAADGRPYMVMEWVDGRPLTEWCHQTAASLAQRLDVFMQVCDAVAYAHRHLLVHRDLKPGNVLVTAEGRVKLLDFGVAKLLTGDADLALHTQAPVTPAYAAPEQLQQHAVTTSADVFALGLLLFELLTGERPWYRPQMGLVALMHKLLREPAPAPSAMAASLREPPVPARQLRGDLDAIVARALRKEPEHRYTTVAALRGDVLRHLRGEAVGARRDIRGYVLGRFLRRYRWAVAGVAALVVTLAAGLGGTYWQAQRATLQARRAEAVQGFLTDLFRANTSHQANPVKARQTTARELLDLGAKKIDTAMADAPEAKIGVLELLAGLYDNLELREESVRLRRQEVDLARQVYGNDAPELADALAGLGGALHSSRAVDEQAAVIDEAERILDRNRDFTSDTRAFLLRKLAMRYMGKDEARALEYARRSVQLYEARPPSKQLTEALSLKGYVEIREGDAREAVASQTRAIQISQTLPERNANVGRYYSYLSDAQARLMDFAAAERSARTALEMALALNGEEHVDHIQAGYRLGNLLSSIGKTQEGLALLQSAKQLTLKIKGSDDPFHTPSVLGHRGKALVAAGDPVAALPDLDAAIAVQSRYHPGTTYLAAMNESRAEALVDLRRYAEARADLDEALRIREKARQVRSSGALNGNIRIRAQLELAQGRFDEARALIASMGIENATPSFDRLEQQLLTAEIDLAAGQFDGVAATAARVRDQIAQTGQAEYLKAYASRADLADGLAQLRLADPAAAVPLLERALALRREVDLPSSARIVEAQAALAAARRQAAR